VADPWFEWWQGFVAWWNAWQTPAVLRQFAGLGVALIAALVVDRLLERYRKRWLREEGPEQSRFRTVLWAVKFPVLVLIMGGIALAAYASLGWHARTLKRLVSLFWYVGAFALVCGVVRAYVTEGDMRRAIRRVMLPLAAVVGVLHLTGLLGTLWAWAQQSALTMASGRITLANLALALAIVAAFWLLARGGKALFLRAILPRTDTDLDLARSVAGFVQFAIVIVGLWVALDSLGIEFSNLTLLITALTVGIGFGLQDIIKNVMGGIILLSEGHVRPHEVFKVGGETGVVERIGIRSTTVRTWDGSQVVVPNADLIADKVVDLTDSRRVDIKVGVSCDADPRLAETLLLEIAAAHPNVEDDPAPSVLFSNLGESSYDFALYCHVAERAQVARTRSDLNFAVVETFRQHELEMPYRQLDLHLRSGPWSKIDLQSRKT
jgi:small-conductance mechanosensitive channel